MSNDKFKEMFGSIPTTIVVQLLVGVFALGTIWIRFTNLEQSHSVEKTELQIVITGLLEQIEELEKNKASKTELKSVIDRQRRKIKDFDFFLKVYEDDSKENLRSYYELKYNK